MNYNKINPKAIGDPNMVSNVTGITIGSNDVNPMVNNSYTASVDSIAQQAPLSGSFNDLNGQLIKNQTIAPPQGVATKITPPYNLNTM